MEAELEEELVDVELEDAVATDAAPEVDVKDVELEVVVS